MTNTLATLSSTSFRQETLLPETTMAIRTPLLKFIFFQGEGKCRTNFNLNNIESCMLSLAWNGSFSLRQSEFRIDLQTGRIKVHEINLRLQYNTKAKKYWSEKISPYEFYVLCGFFLRVKIWF